MAGILAGPIGAAFIIHSAVCASSDHASLAQLISISFFMSGLCTVLQVTFGVRYTLQFSAVVFAAGFSAPYVHIKLYVSYRTC